MTPAELRALLSAGTKGPWELDGFSCIGTGLGNGLFYYTINDNGVHATNPNDPALIVAAVNSLPALLDRVERLEAENERLKVYERAWHKGAGGPP